MQKMQIFKGVTVSPNLYIVYSLASIYRPEDSLPNHLNASSFNPVDFLPEDHIIDATRAIRVLGLSCDVKLKTLIDQGYGTDEIAYSAGETGRQRSEGLLDPFKTLEDSFLQTLEDVSELGIDGYEGMQSNGGFSDGFDYGVVPSNGDQLRGRNVERRGYDKIHGKHRRILRAKQFKGELNHGRGRGIRAVNDLGYSEVMDGVSEHYGKKSLQQRILESVSSIILETMGKSFSSYIESVGVLPAFREIELADQRLAYMTGNTYNYISKTNLFPLSMSEIDSGILKSILNQDPSIEYLDGKSGLLVLSRLQVRAITAKELLDHKNNEGYRNKPEDATHYYEHNATKQG